MIDIEITETKKVGVAFLKVEAGVRYWEDGEVNGVSDDDGNLIPCRNGDFWEPIIDLKTGMIEGWPEGTTADVHYKVCDEGRYTLLDAARNAVNIRDGYVPPILSPGGDGYGDYIIMKIDGAGRIENWRINLDGFAVSK
jgi:hypothetical protein